MFAGLVERLGEVVAVTATNQGAQIDIHLPRDYIPDTLGSSIAVNGVCLTMIERQADMCRVEVSKHTLMVTALKELTVGDSVHVERSLALGAPIHGHLVAGHVDAITCLESIEVEGNSQRWILSVPELIQPYIAPKGSVCVHGVSLTVAEVYEHSFSVVLIPHTLQETTLGSGKVGMNYNIEADLLARYCARILDCAKTFSKDTPVITDDASLYDTAMMEGQRG